MCIRDSYIGSGTDLPLCAEGRAQLEELKAKFQYPDVPLVFCSPMLLGYLLKVIMFRHRGFGNDYAKGYACLLYTSRCV